MPIRLARKWIAASFFILPFIIALPPALLAAVTIGNVTNSTGQGIFTHNNNGNLLILIGTRRSRLSYNIGSASYNGVSLVAVPNCRRENSTAASVIAFYLVNPPQGSHTISTSGGGSTQIRTAISVAGANVGGAPFGSCATNAGNSTSASVSVPSAAGELVLAATAKMHTAETVTVSSGQTQKWNLKSSATSSDIHTTAVGSIKAGAASVVMTHGWSGTARMWSMLGIPLRAASSTTESPVVQAPSSDASSGGDTSSGSSSTGSSTTASSTGQAFYFSPDAPSTNGSCTESAPCRLALLPSKAMPGARMILKNGIYRASGTVLLLDSTKNTVNGTSTGPITVRAQNPGQAFLLGNGTIGQVLKMRVNWWIIEDLRIENVNNSSYTGSEASPLRCMLCNNVIIRRNIVRNPNAWGNSAALSISGTSNLIEDNDILRFHRNGLTLSGTSTKNNVVRGNYVGQTMDRLYSAAFAPNDGFVAYDSPSNIWENNIFDQTGSTGGLTGTQGFVAWGANNRYYGNISIGATNNGMMLVSKNGSTTGAGNYVVRDQVSIGMAQIGLLIRSPIKADVRGFTAHTSKRTARGFVANDGDGASSTSATVRNMMLIDTSGASTSGIDTLTLSHSHEWGSSSSWGSGTSGKTSSPPSPPGDVNPNFGACRVFVPDTSPYKGVGYNGGDVGATVLYAYENGILTKDKLWDDGLTGASRGRLRIGPAVIAGANDTSTGAVRATLHQRLGFGNGGCVFPSSY